MTQEPKETLTDEPEAAVEVTSEPQDEVPAAEDEAAENPMDRESSAVEPEIEAKVEEVMQSDPAATADVAGLEDDAEEETPDEPHAETDTDAAAEDEEMTEAEEAVPPDAEAAAEATEQEDDADEEAPDEPLDDADASVEVEEHQEVETEDEADVLEPAAEPGDEESDPVASDQAPQDDAEAPEESEAVAEAEPEATVESVIEAILFASDEPLTDSRIANIVETTGKQVRQSIKDLNARYESNNHAFRIEQIAGGYQMLTLSGYNHWLRKMLRARSDTKLSPAAMETLAIIAYKQPIIRADIEAIRGVAVGEVIRSLMYKGLVKIVGRAEVLGRPMLYGTTKKFLQIFGLNSLKDLPKVEELKNPDR